MRQRVVGARAQAINFFLVLGVSLRMITGNQSFVDTTPEGLEYLCSLSDELDNLEHIQAGKARTPDIEVARLALALTCEISDKYDMSEERTHPEETHNAADDE